MAGGPRWDRRNLLRTGAAALGGAGVGWSAATAVAATAPAPPTASGPTTVVGPPAGAQTVPALGRHQAGIATTPQAHLALVGWDLKPEAGRRDLARMMRLLSDDAARLGAGRPALADTEPDLALHPARLTVTFGFGPQVLRTLVPAQRRPVLEELPAFSRDELEEQWSQTDVVAQICCDDPVTLAHARRMLLKDARPFAEVRWIQHGFRTARGTVPEGTTSRNLMGQIDGTVNPTEADPDFAPLVWTQTSDTDPFAGGTFLVVRRIRMQLDRWDRVDRAGREGVIGRRLDTGAPLTGTDEFDAPDFAATDHLGLPVIDPASHVARARSSDPTQRFLRRAYNYTEPDPRRSTGEDSGLLFLAYAADPARQFVPVQQRLDELDRLNAWVTTVGSAVYAVPPAAPEGGYVGQPLLEGADDGVADS